MALIEPDSMPGSSPSTRGQLGNLRGIIAILGLIPVYAGTTQFALLDKMQDRAHPRLRGDNNF